MFGVSGKSTSPSKKRSQMSLLMSSSVMFSELSEASLVHDVNESRYFRSLRRFLAKRRNPCSESRRERYEFRPPGLRPHFLQGFSDFLGVRQVWQFEVARGEGSPRGRCVVRSEAGIRTAREKWSILGVQAIAERDDQ